MAESTGMLGLRREFCSRAEGHYMQMVRVYCEKRAPYEYVKWETKQKETERERERYEWSKDNEGNGMRNDRFVEKRK